jgi:protein-S-isoprenylcysteine O-methyltransferase Ste14
MISANQKEDQPSIPIPPPLIFVACLGSGFLLDHLFPSKIFQLTGVLRLISSGILILFSGYLALGSIFMLLRNKTPFDPSKPTLKIVCQGPFRFSRNPMYLALVLLMAGAAVFTGSLWMCLAVPVLWIALDIVAVRPEEDYLERSFGVRYLEYKAKVRRWF